jgi:hypothetical protein
MFKLIMKERLHEAKSEIQAAIHSVPPHHRLKRAVKLIEEELQLTPWNLTKNFVNARKGNSQKEHQNIILFFSSSQTYCLVFLKAGDCYKLLDLEILQGAERLIVIYA